MTSNPPELINTRLARILLKILETTRDAACLSAASLPTGTGKTIASNHFSDKHCGEVVRIELNQKVDAARAINLLISQVGFEPRSPHQGDLFAHRNLGRAPVDLGPKKAERTLSQLFRWRELISPTRPHITLIVDGAQWLANRNEVSALVDKIQGCAGQSFGGLILLGDERFRLPEDRFEYGQHRRVQYSLHDSLIDRLEQVLTISAADILEDDIAHFLRKRFGGVGAEHARQFTDDIYLGNMRPSFRAIQRRMIESGAVAGAA